MYVPALGDEDFFWQASLGKREAQEKMGDCLTIFLFAAAPDFDGGIVPGVRRLITNASIARLNR